MVTLFIMVAFIVIRCTVNLETAAAACASVPFGTVGTALIAGGEILFEIVGLITIVRKKGSDE